MTGSIVLRNLEGVTLLCSHFSSYHSSSNYISIFISRHSTDNSFTIHKFCYIFNFIFHCLLFINMIQTTIYKLLIKFQRHQDDVV